MNRWIIMVDCSMGSCRIASNTFSLCLLSAMFSRMQSGTMSNFIVWRLLDWSNMDWYSGHFKQAFVPDPLL